MEARTECRLYYRPLSNSSATSGGVWPSSENPERLVMAEFMRFAAYDQRHRLSYFQRRFHTLLDLVNPDFEAATTPLNVKANAPPSGRQLRVELYAAAVQ